MLSYDPSVHAQDSHGNIGPVHEVYYDDGIFFENLTCARWKLDANEGSSGNSMVYEWETQAKEEKKEKEKKIQPTAAHRQDKQVKKDLGEQRLSHALLPRHDGVGKQRGVQVDGARRDDHGSQHAAQDLCDNSSAKRVQSQVLDTHDGAVKQLRNSQSHGSKDEVGAATLKTLHGKITLKLPSLEQGSAEGNGGGAKRNRDAPSLAPAETCKKVRTENARDTSVACNKTTRTTGDKGDAGDIVMSDGAAKKGDDAVDMMRFNMQGRRWTKPESSSMNGGDWLLNRCVRLWWDEEAQWFPGIVVQFDGRREAVDSHGTTGPVHAIVYEDGRFLENLSTAKWQFDAKEGPPGVSAKHEGSSEGPSKPDSSSHQAATHDHPPPATSNGHSRAGKCGSYVAESDASVVTEAGPNCEVDEKDDAGGGKGWRGDCDKLLGRLMRQDSAIPFLEPVDAVAMNIPDYFKIIKRPMDLGTVRSNLQDSRYGEPVQVLQDIVRCFDNAIEYNPSSEPAHKLAIAIKASFTSLCNGSQVLRPVLRCLHLSRQDGRASNKMPSASASSPVKSSGAASSPRTSSPIKKPRPGGPETDGGHRDVGGHRDGRQKTRLSTSDAPVKCAKDISAPKHCRVPMPMTAPVQVADQDERAGVAEVAAVPGKRGGPRMAAAAALLADESDEFRLKIQTKGRAWTCPAAAFCRGGQWLVGRHIQVYWDDDKTWFPGVVTFYDSSPSTKDSHGNHGPVHDVYYEDGSFLENLGTATWQYDLSEGAAGVKVDLGEDECAAETTTPDVRDNTDKKGLASGAPDVHTDPRAACVSCRQRRIKCVHMAAAAIAAGILPPESPTKKPKPQISPAVSTSQKPVRHLPSPAVAAATVSKAAQPKVGPTPTQTHTHTKTHANGYGGLKPAELRGVKQDLSRKDLEYEVVMVYIYV